MIIFWCDLIIIYIIFRKAEKHIFFKNIRIYFFLKFISMTNNFFEVYRYISIYFLAKNYSCCLESSTMRDLAYFIKYKLYWCYNINLLLWIINLQYILATKKKNLQYIRYYKLNKNILIIINLNLKVRIERKKIVKRREK